MKKICKNLLKIILALILVVLIAIIVVKTYGQLIIFNIVDAMENYTKGEFSVRVTTNYIIDNSNEEHENIEEYIKNKNNFVIKYNYNDDERFEWFDLENKNEFYNFCTYDLDEEPEQGKLAWYTMQTSENIEDNIKLAMPSFFSLDIRERLEWYRGFDKIESLLHMPTVNTCEYENKQCYELANMYGEKTYVDKETLLPLAIISEETSRKYEYNIEYDEKILQEPDITQFDKIEYHDYFNMGKSRPVIEYGEFPENPITGTNLDPKETLIENVLLKENEEINVLPVTANSFGVKRIDIDSLELYNKLRNKYTNLRELTEDDFSYYTASIIYKEGYELIYVENKEAIDSFNNQYIFNEKQSENESVTLIVKPRAKTGGYSIVISNEKMEIPSTQILETYFAVSNELEEHLGLDKDLLYCSNAGIVKLDSKYFENLDYIKTPAKEGNTIFWEIKAEIQVRTVYYGDVYTYIDAITGEVIGAKYIKNNN